MSPSEQPSPGRLPFPRLVRYLAEAGLFFLFIGLFRALGLGVSSAIAGFFGREIFCRMGVVNRARANLRAAFPDKSASEIEDITREMCENLGRTLAEYAHLDKIAIVGPNPRIADADHAATLALVSAAAERGKGVIFFSGHFANWEVLQFIASHLGFGGGAVYRPQNNPFVDRWLVRQRMRNCTNDQITKGPGGTRRIFTLLRQGGMISLLVDQKTNEGVPVLFFGREAMTTPAPAALALKLGAALLPAQLERTGGAHFRFRLHPPIEFTPSGNHAQDTLELTQRITEKIESMVRERPSQWLWIHRRWPTEREQDQVRGKRALQGAEGGAGVRVEREGSSLI
jgi:KDO2-lipid IV(A) lauroyltransferase